MMNQHTIRQLKGLKLDGMARAFTEQIELAASTSLGFEERLALLVDREVAWRDNRRLARLLKQARLRAPQACLEDVDYRPSRGVERRVIASLGSCDWVRHAQNVLLTGSTGVGKTWLACALANAACRQGFSAFYVRNARLIEELKIAHGDGSFRRRLASLARIDVLLIDDWALGTLDQGARADLLEVLDDRVGLHSTIVTSQLPIEHWHAWLGEPTLADAILDRLVHQAHRLALTGDSLRGNDPSSTHKKD
jgi:DNA replication protein DnaC